MMKWRIVSWFLCIAASLPNFAQKVVGGQNAGQYEFQFLAGLGHKNGVIRNPAEQFCGGSLIRDNFILTAAHCLYDDNGNSLKANEIFVFLNVWDLENPNQEIELYNVSQIIEHKNYNDFTSENDIALLKINGRTNLNPVTLPAFNDESLLTAGRKCTVSGWGATNKSGDQYPTVLQKVELEIISNATCNSSTWYDGEVLSSMLCAGYAAGQKDACYGDSGGPLFVMENGDTTQIGVVSWGYGCAEARQPGVYAKVSRYINWINTNIADATANVTDISISDNISISTAPQTIMIDNQLNSRIEIQITDLLGRVITQTEVAENEETNININPGAYVINTYVGQNVWVKKMIIW
jgi:secreted trypsin-like serine protease